MPQTVVHFFKDAKGHVPFQEWLDDLETTEPRAYAKCLQRILELSQFGFEMGRPLSASLQDGINELRSRVGNVHFRPLYFFSNRCAVISHGITKEGAVPNKEIKRASKYKKLVDRDFKKYTTEFDI